MRPYLRDRSRIKHRQQRRSGSASPQCVQLRAVRTLVLNHRQSGAAVNHRAVGPCQTCKLARTGKIVTFDDSFDPGLNPSPRRADVVLTFATYNDGSASVMAVPHWRKGVECPAAGRFGVLVIRNGREKEFANGWWCQSFSKAAAVKTQRDRRCNAQKPRERVIHRPCSARVGICPWHRFALLTAPSAVLFSTRGTARNTALPRSFRIDRSTRRLRPPARVAACLTDDRYPANRPAFQGAAACSSIARWSGQRFDLSGADCCAAQTRKLCSDRRPVRACLMLLISLSAKQSGGVPGIGQAWTLALFCRALFHLVKLGCSLSGCATSDFGTDRRRVAMRMAIKMSADQRQ